jgi:3-oxoacyl-[acyl-carrier protein] reductase
VIPIGGALQNRVILVSGGSRGIGRACCRRFAEAGADVALSFLRSEEAARDVGREVAELGREALVVHADAATPEGNRAFVDRVLREWGGFDGVVANAGIVAPRPAEQLDLPAWRATVETDLLGPALLLEQAGPTLRSRRGSAVIVSSIAGLRAGTGEIDYHVAKAGALMLTRCLALAYAPEVRVNAVAPGWVVTDMNAEEYANLSFRESVRRATPLGRWGQPADVAESVLFLLSEEARFITGQTLVVDGGQLLHWGMNDPPEPVGGSAGAADAGSAARPQA